MREESAFKKGFRNGFGAFYGLFFGVICLQIAEKFVDKREKSKAENGDEEAQAFCKKWNIKYDKSESQEETESRIS